MQIFYASHDGHTRKIATTLADKVREKGCAITLCDLESAFPTPQDLAPQGPIILLAAIRYGFHLPIARRFIRTHHARLAQGPLVLVSINLTARKPAKRTAETNVYLRKWIKRARLTPTMALALAGNLDYPRYGIFDRFMIRLIMTITGGPTDPTACVDFTPWDVVDSLADQIAALPNAALAPQ